jgi:hypothetical protein
MAIKFDSVQQLPYRRGQSCSMLKNCIAEHVFGCHFDRRNRLLAARNERGCAQHGIALCTGQGAYDIR